MLLGIFARTIRIICCIFNGCETFFTAFVLKQNWLGYTFIREKQETMEKACRGPEICGVD